MSDFVLVREIKVGDLLTAGSVVLGTLTLLYALLKDRLLRRRERLPHATSMTLNHYLLTQMSCWSRGKTSS
jgi:hypothetical protein